MKDEHRRTFPTKPVSQRQLRVGEQIRHELSSIIREAKFRDPDLQEPAAITITMAEIGADLKNAHIYVMPLGGKNADAIVSALNRASAYLRGELGKRIDLRHIPKLTFRLDHSFDATAHIESLLKKGAVARDEDTEEKE